MLEQRGADCLPELGDMTVDAEPQMFEDDAARQRVTVGVEPGRGHADEQIADVVAYLRSLK